MKAARAGSSTVGIPFEVSPAKTLSRVWGAGALGAPDYLRPRLVVAVVLRRHGR